MSGEMCGYGCISLWQFCVQRKARLGMELFCSPQPGFCDVSVTVNEQGGLLDAGML